MHRRRASLVKCCQSNLLIVIVVYKKQKRKGTKIIIKIHLVREITCHCHSQKKITSLVRGGYCPSPSP